ncbi:MAG: hypothetical protein C0483_26405 [Pirellula sp.]|nr:hypothetical protein [Pirellula sp.]
MSSNWPKTPGDASPDDNEAADLAEGWSALEQLIAKSGTARMDLAAQTRLLAEIGRTARRRRVVQLSAMAAAACLLVALAFAWKGRGDNAAQEIVLQTGAPKGSPSSTLPRATASAVIAVNVKPTEKSAAPKFLAPEFANSEIAEPTPWIDPLDAEFESTRAYAGEVEHRWRVRSDRWWNLEEQARQLQAEWNSASL